MAKKPPSQGRKTSAAGKARQAHLEVLLRRLTAHADVVRHHLPSNTHNATLGHAAEAGVRDVLRQVLPNRLAVTSGFVRQSGGGLIAPTGKGRVSPQTDVILYDALRATPLYGVDGIDVIAARDVVGVIEVKDSSAGETDLSPRPQKNNPQKFTRGALEHVSLIGDKAKQALRAIVLVRGGDPSAARAAFEKENLTGETTPHVLYCRSLEGKASYLAFHDYLENQVRFYDYRGDAVSAFAGFLRVVTGFCAAEGLCSTSLPADLSLPQPTDELPPLQLTDRGGLSSLFDEIRAKATKGVGHDEALATFVRSKIDLGLLCATRPVIGRGKNQQPTAGRSMEIEWQQGKRWERRASFFTLSDDQFTCVEPATSPTPWIVGAPLKEHVRRVCRLEEALFAERLGHRRPAPPT